MSPLSDITVLKLDLLSFYIIDAYIMAPLKEWSAEEVYAGRSDTFYCCTPFSVWDKSGFFLALPSICQYRESSLIADACSLWLLGIHANLKCEWTPGMSLSTPPPPSPSSSKALQLHFVILINLGLFVIIFDRTGLILRYFKEFSCTWRNLY